MVSISVPSSIEFLRRGTTFNVFVGWGTAHKHNLKVDGPCRIYRNRKAQGIRIACQIGNVQFFWLFSFPSGELVVCSPILKRERTERCEIALQERNFILKAVGFAGVEEFGIGPPTETEKAKAALSSLVIVSSRSISRISPLSSSSSSESASVMKCFVLRSFFFPPFRFLDWYLCPFFWLYPPPSPISFPTCIILHSCSSLDRLLDGPQFLRWWGERWERRHSFLQSRKFGLTRL